MASTTRHAGGGHARKQSREPRPSSRQVIRGLIGLVLLVAGSALTGWGIHHIFITGNCSSTGYNSYGPVKTCPSGFALWLTAGIFVGPPLAIVGGLMARPRGLGIPVFLTGLGLGLLTVSSDRTAVAGAKGAGLIIGVTLLAIMGLVLVRRAVRKARGPAVAPPASPSPASPTPASPTPTSPSPTSVTPAAAVQAQPGVLTTTPGAAAPLAQTLGAIAAAQPSPSPPALTPDPIEQIRRLAELRDSGALTSEEFEREKAKLLAQI